MRHQFDYELSRAEYVIGMSALVDQIGRHDTSRTRRLLEQLAIVVVIMLGATIAYPGVAMPLWGAVLAMAVAQSLLVGRWTRGAGGQTYDRAVAAQHVEIADDGIATRCDVRARQWKWSAVRRVYDLKEAVVIELAGWDMVVLPNRLWSDGEQRRTFIQDVRGLATEALPAAAPVQPALFAIQDLLRVGAIAAGVDAMALVVFNLPAHKGPKLPVDDPAYLATFGGVMLLGLGLAYAAYRFARSGLERLHDSAPRIATMLSYALVWAVPAYILIEYFRSL